MIRVGEVFMTVTSINPGENSSVNVTKLVRSVRDDGTTPEGDGLSARARRELVNRLGLNKPAGGDAVVYEEVNLTKVA